MKILAFSDLHCDLEKAKQMVAASASADVVVCAGDFGAKGGEMDETLAVLSAISAPFVMVAGNHDDFGVLQMFAENRPNVYLLHGNSAEIDGQTFFGLGMEIPLNPSRAWNLTISEADATQQLAACPDDAILITHSPPFGHCDLQRNGENEGSHAIHALHHQRRLKLHLCGHIHNAWGMTSTLNDCPIHNLGPTENWFDV